MAHEVGPCKWEGVDWIGKTGAAVWDHKMATVSAFLGKEVREWVLQGNLGKYWLAIRKLMLIKEEEILKMYNK